MPSMDGLEEELARRMARPQRHRLLQGYPMAPILRREHFADPPLERLELDHARPLLVGVLPHTACNPKVKGCGFCTFPNEPLARPALREVVAQVEREIARTVERMPALRARRVPAVYLGGGTANLTPADQLARLCATLAASFDLADAELTLEGVPRYFVIRDEAQLAVLADAPVGRRRISMGVQTFDPDWLRRMGRDAFGDRAEIARVVAAAHRRGTTASADLLFNLPGAAAALAVDDVRTAIELGFDQICLYNLVLTAELDSTWARDPALVAAMPDVATAHDRWLALRELLLASGYVQTTLTNFERTEGPQRFVYEPASFDPGRHDGLGFGPAAISTFTARDRRAALKWINHEVVEEYAYGVAQDLSVATSTFHYTPLDLRLLHATRNLSRLAIDRAAYRGFFATDVTEDFAPQLACLSAAGLVQIDPARVALTPTGMFYADAVAGLLAHRRVASLARHADDPAARRDRMG
jgi:oxygen-independent coproporphyrinogen-3 oxidase